MCYKHFNKRELLTGISLTLGLAIIMAGILTGIIYGVTT
jgi:hypothetical protein